MILPGLLEQARAYAVSVMDDACRVTRRSGSASQDEATGREVPGPTGVIYEGPCRVQVPSVQPGSDVAGERSWTTQPVVVSVPVSADPRTGDLVEVVSAAADPLLVGRTYRVRAVLAKSHATARRMTCEEVA